LTSERESGTALQAGKSRVRFLIVLLGFFIEFFGPHFGRGVDSVCKRNEFQGYQLGRKGGRCLGLSTLPPSCGKCLEILGTSNSWKPKGLSGPL